MINQTISHYKILEKLGEGGMGVVYKAHDTKLDREVALKFLPRHVASNETDRTRFLQEAKAAAILNHPNVCIIYSIEEFEGTLFLEMEYIEGLTLKQKLSEKKLTIYEIIEYALQIGDALQEAHSKGIVHRDVKSENIMINSKNQIKVMDFGLAKLKGSIKLTQSHSTTGTLAYMSPEQIRGDKIDGRTDLFSFGVVLYEMLTAHLPFRGEHEAAMMYSIMNEEPQPIQKFREAIPSGLLHIVNRALEKNSEDRYQTAVDMMNELRRIIKETARVDRTQIMQTPPHWTSKFETTKISFPIPLYKMLLIGSIIIGFLTIWSVWYFFFHIRNVELNPNLSFRTLNIPFKDIGYPGFSQDGNLIAFVAADINNRIDVYLMNANTLEYRRVTNDSIPNPRNDNYGIGVGNADLSPDGSQIIRIIHAE